MSVFPLDAARSGLVVRLDDPELAVRVAAADALVAFGEAGVARLTGWLVDGSEVVRAAAVGGLGRGRVAGAAVLGRLSDASALVRMAAIEAAARIRIGDEAIGARLVEDVDPDVRRVAADGLATLASAPGVAADRRDAVVAALVAALGDDAVRETALAGLARIGWEPDSDTGAAIVALAKRDWDALVGLGPIGRPLLVRALRDTSPDRDAALTRARVAETLGRIGGPEAAAALERALEDVAGPVRAQATREVGRMHEFTGATAGPVLRRLLTGDPLAAVRVGAATALGMMRHAAARDELRTVAEGDADPRVRLAAAEARAGIGETGLLIEQLEAPEAEVRRRAVVRLGELEAMEAIDPLIVTLGDSYATVRAAALTALQQIGWTPVGVKRTIEDPRYSRWMTRAEQEARTGLSATDQRRMLAADLQADDPLVRQAALEALALRREASLATLALPLLDDPVRQVRTTAADTLRVLDAIPDAGPTAAAWCVAMNQLQAAVAYGADALAPLLRALSEHPAGERAEAARTLAVLGDPAASEALTVALSDPEAYVQVNAALALGALSGHAAVPALQTLLTRRHSTVRTAAARTLVGLAEPGLAALIESLDSGVAVAREAAALGLELAKARGVAAAPRLGELLGSDPHIPVREGSARALGAMPGPQPSLAIAALSDASWHVRRAAARSIGAHGRDAGDDASDTLIRCLGDSYRGVREAALKSLKQVGWVPDGPVSEAMIRLAAEDWRGVVAVGAPALSLLSRALTETGADSISVERRVRVLETVEAIGLKGAAEQAGSIVVPALEDVAGPVRALAARAAGALAVKAAGARLLELAETDPSNHARVSAAAALGRAGSKDMTERLTALATSASLPAVRLAACRALAGPAIGDIAQLVLALTSPSDEVRAGAARELGDVGNPEAIEPLIATLGDAVQAVRTAARRSLELLGWTPVGVRGDADEAGYRRWLTLEEIGGTTGEVDQNALLLSALSSEAIEVRRGALEALSERARHAGASAGAAPPPQADWKAAAKTVVPLLDDPDLSVRAEAAVTLEAMAAVPQKGAIAASWCVAAGRFEDAAALGADAVASLIRTLQEHGVDDRIAAVDALATVGGDDAASAVTGRLSDPSFRVRTGAITGLARLVGEAAAAPLVALLDDDDLGTRNTAAATLCGLGKAGVVAVRDALSDPRPRVRTALVGAIAGLDAPGPKLITALAKRVQGDDAASVRALALPILARAMGNNALDLLSERLREDEAHIVRVAAARAIGILAPKHGPDLLVPALGDDYGEVRDAVLAALRGMGWEPDAGVTKAVLALASQDWPTLLQLGEEAAPLLAGALRDRAADAESRRKREEAVTCLGRIGGDVAKAAVLEAFDDGGANVRAAAAGACALLQLKEARDVLVERLAHDPDFRVRAKAASALGALGIPDTAPALGTATVQDDDPTVRSAAAIALAGPGIGDVERLINQLTDADADARRVAALELGNLGARKALDPLLSTLSDAYASVREAAKSSLSQLEWIPFGVRRTPDAPGYDRWVLRKELSPKSLDTPQLDVLLGAVGHADPLLRAAVAEGLSMVGGPKAAKALAALAKDPNEGVADTARRLS